MENDASNMKDVLSHMEGTSFEGDPQLDIMHVALDNYHHDMDAGCGQETRAEDVKGE